MSNFNIASRVIAPPLLESLSKTANSVPVTPQRMREILVPRLIEPDAATLSHVVFDENGIIDPYDNNWTFQNEPPSNLLALPEPAIDLTRRRVGVFSDSNYFTQGTAGSSLVNVNSAFTVAIAFLVTDISNSPYVFSNITGAAQGFGITLTSGSGAYLLCAGFAGPLSLGKVKTGFNILVCGVNGVGAATAFIKLNSTPVVSTLVTYNPTASGVSTIGRYNGGTGFSFNGTIEEMLFSTDVPTVNLLNDMYERANAAKSADYRFQSANTTLHLHGRDYSGGTWTTPQGALTTVGTVSSSTYEAIESYPLKYPRYVIDPAGQEINTGGDAENTVFYYMEDDDNVFDEDGVFSGAILAIPTQDDIDNTAIYLSTGVSSGFPGWQLVNEFDETVFISSSGQVESVPATPNKLNVICFGFDGTDLHLKVNDNPMQTFPGEITINPTYRRGAIGMHWDDFIGFQGAIVESWFSTTSPSEKLFSEIVNRVLLKA